MKSLNEMAKKFGKTKTKAETIGVALSLLQVSIMEIKDGNLIGVTENGYVKKIVGFNLKQGKFNAYFNSRTTAYCGLSQNGSGPS